jgi:2-succinyl-5-enolpyruvyl-6-hydroxy-3-cyclohexene-1-carboxylate synthase
MEWIDQLDGQTIRQSQIYGGHVKQFYQLPSDFDHPDAIWATHRMVNEAILISQRPASGPVHLNVPLREPLYPLGTEEISFTSDLKFFFEERAMMPLSTSDFQYVQESLKSYTKILVVGGQQQADSKLLSLLQRMGGKHGVAIVGDIISNLHALPETIRYADSFLANASHEIKTSLQPEVLITFGLSVISKNLKLFLRRYKPGEHWHIDEGAPAADTFQSLTRIIRTSPQSFFEKISLLPPATEFEQQKHENYKRLWEVEEHRAQRTTVQFFQRPELNEFYLMQQVMNDLPEGTRLHLANSMTVRYANFIGLREWQHTIRVHGNRGTSGIDGCTSTVVGHSLQSDALHVLITGDLAFFYDRNAFWHNYPLPQLRIVVLNNHGGVIFGMIDGPGDLPEAEELFITRQKLSAKALCLEFGIEYAKVDHLRKVKNVLSDFFEPSSTAKLIEIETDTRTARDAFDAFKKSLREAVLTA